MARYPGLTLRVLAEKAPAMGPGRAELIARIEREGSISAAARSMGMSYRRAWQLVEAINASFQAPVVATEVGGRCGGGARVTPFGRKILQLYRAMEDRATAAIRRDLERFERYLRRPPRARRSAARRGRPLPRESRTSPRRARSRTAESRSGGPRRIAIFGRE